MNFRTFVVLLLLFATLGLPNLFAQDKDKNFPVDYRNLEQALRFPKETTHLKLYTDSIAFNRFIQSNIPFEKLQSVIIIGEINNKKAELLFAKLSSSLSLTELKINSSNFSNINALSELNNLQKLSLFGCPDINYELLFEKLAAFEGFTFLALENNDLNKLPKNIEKLINLNTLRIASNSLLNYHQVLKIVSKMPNLSELQLPMNDLAEIPSLTAKLDKLESLDLSSNNVVSLPDNFSELKKLKSLKIEGNYIVDLAAELEKLKNSNLKLLSVDRSLNTDQLHKLKKLFPNAQIREIDTFNDAEFVYNSDFDSLSLNGSNVQKNIENIIQQIDSGTFKIYRNEVKALSNAYLFYPQLFKSQKFSYDFDSLLFDVRYADTTYSNVYKIQPNQKYPNIVLEMYPEHPKGEVWFDFNRATEVNRSLIKSNPEVNAFVGMKWVYLGPMNYKQFKNAYIKNDQWADVRIHYNEPKKNFTIELKSRRGFTSFQAYPRITDLRSSVENSQKTYAKRQERYLKVLQRREDKFHSKLFKDKERYDLLFKEREAKIWEVFRKQMSEKEKLMSKEEWLAYYDEIMREEKKALYSSSANVNNLKRSLELEGYKILTAAEQAMLRDVKEFYSVFLDENKKKIADSQVLIIAPGKKEVYVSAGNLGSKETPLFFDFSSNYKIVVENRSGHLSVCSDKELQKVDFSKKNISLTAKTFDKNLTSIGQIRKELKLD